MNSMRRRLMVLLAVILLFFPADKRCLAVA